MIKSKNSKIIYVQKKSKNLKTSQFLLIIILLVNGILFGGFWAWKIINPIEVFAEETVTSSTVNTAIGLPESMSKSISRLMVKTFSGFFTQESKVEEGIDGFIENSQIIEKKITVSSEEIEGWPSPLEKLQEDNIEEKLKVKERAEEEILSEKFLTNSNIRVIKMLRNSESEIWIENIENKNLQKIADKEIVGKDFILGVEDNIIFWVSPDQKSIICFDTLRQIYFSQTIESSKNTIIEFNSKKYILLFQDDNLWLIPQ